MQASCSSDSLGLQQTSSSNHQLCSPWVLYTIQPANVVFQNYRWEVHKAGYGWPLSRGQPRPWGLRWQPYGKLAYGVTAVRELGARLWIRNCQVSNWNSHMLTRIRTMKSLAPGVACCAGQALLALHCCRHIPLSLSN